MSRRIYFRLNDLPATMAMFIAERGADAMFDPVFTKWFKWAKPLIAHANQGEQKVREEYLRGKFRQVWLEVDSDNL